LNNSAEDLKKFKIRVETLPADNDTSFVGAALVARMNQDKPISISILFIHSTRDLDFQSRLQRELYQEKGAKVFE
jgi:hypothetical protein